MPGHNLTRAEAADRAAVVSTASYHVELDLTGPGPNFRSRTTIRFDARAGASTFVDLIADEVHSISLNGVAVDSAAFADSRIALLGLAAHNELVVDAACRYSNTGEGLHRFVDPVDGEAYLYSQFEVADARRVFAVFEQPDLKATFAFTVTAPGHWTVFSNEEGVRTGRADGTAVWSFGATPRLSSYVTALVAGPYVGSTGELTSSDGRTIPLGVYCRTSLAEHLEAAEIMDITRAGFAFFEEAFQRPYPFSKYDQVFVPEFNAGAMENAGCVTFTETYVFRSKVPDARRERRVITVLHELAHMWFGDLVTMRWWNDLWLNESFAEFMSHLATVAATDWTGAWTTFNSLEKSWAYNQDQLPSTHPIVAEISDLEDVEVNFDGITYAKGASVLRQLVAWVGQENFLAGVARYLARHQWSNTELPDLMAELERTSGRDLGDWTGLWLETAGVNLLHPVLETEVRDGVETITRLAIRQEAPASHPTLRPHRLVVGCYDVVDGVLERTRRVELDVVGPLTEVPELTGVPRSDLLLINDEDLAYARIRLDEASLATATGHLAGLESLPRSLVLSAAWDMTRDGEWPAARFCDLVLAVIGSIADSTVVMVLLRQLDTATRHYSAPAGRATLAQRVGDGLLRLAEQAAAGSDLQFQLLKAAAAHAHTPQQLDAVAAIRAGERRLAGLAIDTDLDWDLLTALVAGGRAGAADVDAALAADRTANGEQAAARAAASIPTAAAKRQVWDRLMHGKQLPNAIQLATIGGFTNVEDRGLLAEFVDPYFAQLESVWAQRTSEMAEQIVQGLFPLRLAGLGVGGIDVVARSRRWLEEHPQAPAALRRLVTESMDAARRAVAAQAVDAGSRE